MKVKAVGVEPTTLALKVRYSTTELRLHVRYELSIPLLSRGMGANDEGNPVSPLFHHYFTISLLTVWQVYDIFKISVWHHCVNLGMIIISVK